MFGLIRLSLIIFIDQSEKNAIYIFKSIRKKCNTFCNQAWLEQKSIVNYKFITLKSYKVYNRSDNNGHQNRN